jgi:sugar phosphate permease
MAFGAEDRHGTTLSGHILLPSFLLLTGSTRNGVLVLVAGAFAFFYFCAQPIGNILLASYTSAKARGRGYGISFFFSFGVGSMAAGFCGLIAEKISLSAVFYVLSAVTLLQASLAFTLVRIHARARSQFGSA